jgi:hypothetical protein
MGYFPCQGKIGEGVGQKRQELPTENGKEKNTPPAGAMILPKMASSQNG